MDLFITKTKGVFYVENGRKPYSTLGIIIHEMTHIWEIGNRQFLKAKELNEDWVEGLAVWTDLFLMEKYSEENKLPSRRESDEKAWTSRTDEYGRGLRLILSTCADNPYEYLAIIE